MIARCTRNKDSKSGNCRSGSNRTNCEHKKNIKKYQISELERTKRYLRLHSLLSLRPLGTTHCSPNRRLQQLPRRRIQLPSSLFEPSRRGCSVRKQLGCSLCGYRRAQSLCARTIADEEEGNGG